MCVESRSTRTQHAYVEQQYVDRLDYTNTLAQSRRDTRYLNIIPIIAIPRVRVCPLIEASVFRGEKQNVRNLCITIHPHTHVPIDCDNNRAITT